MTGSQNAQAMAYIRHQLRTGRTLHIMDEPLEELEYVVFDLETTGFDPASDEILSIGAVRMRGAEVLPDQSFYRLVRTSRQIPPVVQALTGITEQMASSDGVQLIDALHDFLAFTGSRLLIAHASGHDKPFLTTALWRTSRAQWTHRILDTLLIARWLTPGAHDGYPLDRLLAEAQIPVSTRHHALQDAIMTGKLWGFYQRQMKARHVTTLADLYAHLVHV
jgi:DNA polymerase-3 subunit epsilon